MIKKLLYLPWLLLTGISYGQDYNYLGTFDSEGTPDYLTTPDVVSESTLKLVADALPEGYPVPDYNPHYISSGYDTDIILYEEAEVWVTFVAEGAGYKNVLGFFTYEAGSPPPTTPQPEDITIVFPNVSAKWSGGGLYAGDKVKIGRFPAGTAIGWVLFANGWRGKVTGGHWQVYSRPEYNPESDPTLQFHNVLLSDSENERIILGFEDIRRDYGSCDQDFNDALFYITASPYTALKTENLVRVEDRNDVSSGNDGGLESHGRLAQKIAKRTLKRRQTGSALNQQDLQVRYSAKSFNGNFARNGNLDTYFPETGMMGTEEARVSSPEDLLEITNADKVFSVDYYQGNERVAAALALNTLDGVYNHTKYICDRLNDAELTDVRTLELQGHRMVYTRMERAEGTEHTLAFAIREGISGYELFSTWNLSDYPQGDYMNFQVWGSSMGQVSTLVSHILQTLEADKPVITTQAPRIPEAFVRKGYYRDGALHLKIENPGRVSSLTIDGNLKRTELSAPENVSFTQVLSGNRVEWIEIPTGHLFDIGLRMTTGATGSADDLYLADGPWGIDLDTNRDEVPAWNIAQHKDSINSELKAIFGDSTYLVERGLEMSGKVEGTINVFRHLLAGDRSLDVSAYAYMSIELQQDRPIEISLITTEMKDWNDRLRLKVVPDSTAGRLEVAFSEFRDGSGNPRNFEQLTSIVFSVQGNYQEAEEFAFAVNGLALTTKSITEVGEETTAEDTTEESTEEETSEESTEAETAEAATEAESVSNDTSSDEATGAENQEETNETEQEAETASNPLSAPSALPELKQARTYPNPFESSFKLILPEATKELHVTLSNLRGQVVWKQKVRAGMADRIFEMVVPGLPSGVYVYRAFDFTNGQQYEGKVIRK
ncbi:Por secretion system C-terminal sorting domain-containing protein [Robiginitalea myxolifaciens]|uniref:Por secretion system C-terminal sorting domain-containing protein n=1 Tax=Robiginitalea myxolifaciens TaxID=400055 RepID=A0A1I6G127_9FLAO|nr:DUF4114 domain-containing protein [Robiginitalea myxolifaciens]SFR35894.1 Por secretion system C-terminal sorting domain-containing protein [Robiginitalea myxolifaciens]